MAHIEDRGNGSYRITVTRVEEGKRKRYRKTVQGTKKQADKQAIIFEAEVEQGKVNLSKDNIKFTQFAQLWINKYVKKNHKEKTQANYIYLLNRFVVPHIGSIKLDHLKPLHIIDLYNSLRSDVDKPVSETTIAHVHSVIHKCLSDAVLWEYLYSNPADKVPKPKRNKPKKNYLDKDEALIVLNEVNKLDEDDFKWKLSWCLALFCGLRLAEIAGLKNEDIDFIDNMIHIKRSRKNVHKRGIIIDTPKTESSFRSINAPTNIMNMLADYFLYKEDQAELIGSKWNDSEYLIVGWNGIEIFPDSITKTFTKFIRKNNLPYCTLHGLRHTMATLLIHDPTISERTIADRLGHANTNTLRGVYSHQLKETDRLAADSLMNILDTD